MLSRSGLIVSEVPRELGHRSSDVLMASVGLEVSATVRGCAAAIVIASEGYAISQNAAVLDTGTNAVGNAALSRFELAELQKQEVSVVAVVPSDALAATLVDRSIGGDSGAAAGAGPPLPMHLGGLLAGAVCVRYGDPRRATAQLEEVLRALEGVGVQMPDKTTTAAADGLRDHDDDDDDDDDEVSQSAQVASPTSAAASSGHTATTAGVGDATAEGQADAAAAAAERLALHAKAVAAAQKALDEATAEQAEAQAAVDTAKKKKDKKAAEDVLSEKTAVVEETKAALAKVQADEPSKQKTTEDATASGAGAGAGAGSGPGSGSASSRGDGSQTKKNKTSTTHETESLAAASAPSAGGKSTPEKRAGRVPSERASSVAAGQRVAALTADVRFAPSQFEMSRAAEMRQQDAVDDDALRECAVLVLPLAR